jgi:hypothetical protein
MQQEEWDRENAAGLKMGDNTSQMVTERMKDYILHTAPVQPPKTNVASKEDANPPHVLQDLRGESKFDGSAKAGDNPKSMLSNQRV